MGRDCGTDEFVGINGVTTDTVIAAADGRSVRG